MPETVFVQGESAEYYRPDNSLLPYVLTARRGIPISLAIVHAAVAQRAVKAPMPSRPFTQKIMQAYADFMKVQPSKLFSALAACTHACCVHFSIDVPLPQVGKGFARLQRLSSMGRNTCQRNWCNGARTLTFCDLQGLHVECVGMPMHLVNKMGDPDTPDERFVDVFAGGALLTRYIAMPWPVAMSLLSVGAASRACFPHLVNTVSL